MRCLLLTTLFVFDRKIKRRLSDLADPLSLDALAVALKRTNMQTTISQTDKDISDYFNLQDKGAVNEGEVLGAVVA